MRTKNKGFSVIEFLIAISIFITILGIVILKFEDSKKLGRDSVRVKDFSEISNGLEVYYTKNGKYPIIGGTSTSIKSTDTDWSNVLKTFMPNPEVDPFYNDASKKNTYYYTYCIDNDTTPTQYAIMAKLEAKGQALENDYDEDWPSNGNCDCNPSAGQSDPENSAPYTYCIKNP
jgi:type II secretory pathway pseudopilin PulG